MEGQPTCAGHRFLHELAGPEPLTERLLIVVAHPDDETLGLGAQLCRFRDALLLHLTDGAPRDGADARREGFAEVADYAAARRRELSAALMAGEATRLRTTGLDLPDQTAFLELVTITDHLMALIAAECPTAVLTHAYEGGHPDHDAAAFAVQAACARLAPQRRPAIIEFPLYHAEHGVMCAGFFATPSGDEFAVPVEGAALARKRRMVACFTTQQDILGRLSLSPERFRPAPAYDFAAPPHPGTLLYETFGWPLTGANWRAEAARAARSLGFGSPTCA